MIRLEVSLNGSVLYAAGNEHRSVHVHVTSFSRLESPFAELNLQDVVHRPPSTGEDLAPKLKAALQHPERPASSYPIYWIDRKRLNAGDEITIKLVEHPDDPPGPDPDAPSNSN